MMVADRQDVSHAYFYLLRLATPEAILTQQVALSFLRIHETELACYYHWCSSSYLKDMLSRTSELRRFRALTRLLNPESEQKNVICSGGHPGLAIQTRLRFEQGFCESKTQNFRSEQNDLSYFLASYYISCNRGKMTAWKLVY